MTNDDLKRFYKQNAEPEMSEDFARYTKEKALITPHNATKNDEVVNYQTLIKHAGGAGADINYRGLWTSGVLVAQYDVMYINTMKTRVYYMATSNISESTIAPNVDTDNWIVFLEVERNVQRDNLPEAREEYVDEIVQYIGETTAALTNGFFYKCIQAITYYTIVAEDESITCYCAELPELGQTATLYTDTALTTELTGKELLHITTGYDIVNTGESMGINTTQTPNVEYSWQQWNVQPDIAPAVDYTTIAPTSNNYGPLKFVVLNNEPAERFFGYVYVITNGAVQENSTVEINNVSDSIAQQGNALIIGGN